MGIKGLLPVVSDVVMPMTLEHWSGHRVAVDVSFFMNLSILGVCMASSSLYCYFSLNVPGRTCLLGRISFRYSNGQAFKIFHEAC